MRYHLLVASLCLSFFIYKVKSASYREGRYKTGNTCEAFLICHGKSALYMYVAFLGAGEAVCCHTGTRDMH